MKKIITIICCLFLLVCWPTGVMAQVNNNAIGITTTPSVSAETTNKNIPGVTEEIGSDGVKTVTINLSEIDENKLPERYVPEVILEAPIIGAESGEGTLELNGKMIAKQDMNGIMNLGDKSFTPDGTFLMSSVTDGYPDESSFDVKIDDKGNIYILDILNGRIQMFNNKGKHVKNIPIKNSFKTRWDEVKSYKIYENFKNEIAITDGKIYVRDRSKNKIEQLDETGTIKETIDIPDKIEGQDTAGMKLWADEEGVGVGKWKNVKKATNTIDVKQITPNEFEIWQRGQKIMIVKNIPSEDNMQLIYTDKFNDTYFYFFGMKDNGIIKVSRNGSVLSIIRDWKYQFGKEWYDDCGNKPQPLLLNWAKSMIFDSKGNLYICYKNCCKEKENCLNKIKIIKLSPVKGK